MMDAIRRQRCCPGTICGVDVDDLFSYSTTKRVTIRDAKLGLTYYAFLFGIAGYIINQLVFQGGYLFFASPVSSVRLTLQQPTAQDGHTCNPNKAACQDNFTSPAALPYCWQPDRLTQNVSGVSVATCNCSYMDGSSVSQVRQASILLTTAIHAYNQNRNPACQPLGSPAAPDCRKLWVPTEDEVWYIVDPERFTLLMDHSTTAQGVAIDHSRMLGYIYVDEGGSHQDELCRASQGLDSMWYGSLASEAPCYVPTSKVGEADFFTVGLLLTALSSSLDGLSDTNPGSDPETQRRSGMIVRVAVEYHNFRAFHLGIASEIRYVYKLSRIAGSEYKETRLVSTGYPSQRVAQDLHGVLFEVLPGGSLASFSLTNLLLQLSSSLALFAMATRILDILAQYILKYSPFYRRSMYSTSPNLAALAEATALSDEGLDRELRRCGLQPRGDRVARILHLLAVGWTPETGGGSIQATGTRVERDAASFMSSASAGEQSRGKAEVLLPT